MTALAAIGALAVGVVVVGVLYLAVIGALALTWGGYR